VWSNQPHTQLFDDSNEEKIKDTYRSYDVWYIQKHTRVFDENKVHEIIWTDNEQDEGVIEKPETSGVPPIGVGKGIEFVKLLQPGDRIAVISRNRGVSPLLYTQS